MNKQQQKDKGSNAARPIAMAGLPLGITAGEATKAVKKRFDGLGSDVAKRQFMEDVCVSMERNMPRGWAMIYATLDVMRGEKWYWNGERGYKTFGEFLEAEMGFPFKEFERLEKRYAFAAKCCPSLFKLNKQDIDRLMKAFEEAPPRQPKAGRPKLGSPKKGTQLKPANGQVAKMVDFDAQSAEFQEGYGSRGSTNVIYRFRRLKRDCPKIAQDVLDGKYTKQRKNGEWHIDLKAAEIDAEKRYKNFSRTTRKSRAKPLTTKVMDLLVKCSDDEWNQIVTWMNKQK